MLELFFMYQRNPLLEARKIIFSPGALSANFETLRKIKEPWTRISPNVQDQMYKAAKKKAADEIRSFSNPLLKKRAWRRELSKVDAKIMKNLKAHGG